MDGKMFTDGIEFYLLPLFEIGREAIGGDY